MKIEFDIGIYLKIKSLNVLQKKMISIMLHDIFNVLVIDQFKLF